MMLRWQLPAILALVLAPVAAGAQTQDDAYDRVVTAAHVLALGTDGEKIEAASELGQIAALYSVPALVMALENDSSEVRIAVVGALGRIADASAVDGLVPALDDEDPSVAVAAASALGGMHIDASYSALISALKTVEDGKVKKAVLDGLRKWNEPFEPLPEPLKLPEGKEPPALPGADIEPKPGKKKTIDKENPYGETPPSAVKPPISKDTIDEANPYGPAAPGETSKSALESKGAIDKTNPYEGIPGTQMIQEDTWVDAPVEASRASGAPAAEPEPEPVIAPALPLEMWDMSPSSFVTLEAATASVDDSAGRVTLMQIRGGYVGEHFGAGAVIPFAGGTSQDPHGGFEEWIFANLGLWVRGMGSAELPRLTLRYGGSLTLHVPSGDHITYSDFGTDPDLFPSMGALYASYYRHGLAYPDLEGSFKTSIRPEFDISLVLGRLSFQLELGFDFIVLGKVRDADDPSWKRDLKDVVMFHLGAGAAVRPVPWLQLSLELTTALQLSGTSARTDLFDRELVGDPADHEAFITPGVTVLVPVGLRGTAHIGVGLRVPLGEVGSASGAMQLGPILVLASGFRWGSPPPPP